MTTPNSEREEEKSKSRKLGSILSRPGNCPFLAFVEITAPSILTISIPFVPIITKQRGPHQELLQGLLNDILPQFEAVEDYRPHVVMTLSKLVCWVLPLRALIGTHDSESDTLHHSSDMDSAFHTLIMNFSCKATSMKFYHSSKRLRITGVTL